MLNKGCYRISIVLAFSCGRAKTIRIRFVWMRISLKTEKKNLRFHVWTGPQLSGSLNRAIANMNLLKN